MTPLVLMLLAQSLNTNATNLNQQPLLCMDEGAYCSSRRIRAFELNCSGAGITCAQTGGRMTLTMTGVNNPSVTCAADEALTWNGSAWSCISKIRAAYMADAGITAQYLPITCAAGEFITCNGTSCSCATPSGGGGSGGNFVSDTVTFAAGKYDATKTVTAAWATSGSSIICNADGEEASVEGLTVVVTSKAAGSFVVRAEPRNGRHTGALPFTCTGL